MAQLFEPTPGNPPDDLANAILRDVELLSDEDLGPVAMQSADCQHGVSRQFRLRVSLAALVGVVQQLVSFILFWGFPRQMPLGAASEMPVAASVCRVMFLGRRRAVDFDADKPVDRIGSPVTLQMAVAVRGSGIRPRQAFVTLVGQDNLPEIAIQIARRCPASDGVAVSLPSLVVHFAPAAREVPLVAVLDFAYRFLSHFDLRERWDWSGLKQVLTHRFGPLFMPEKSVSYNCGRG